MIWFWSLLVLALVSALLVFAGLRLRHRRLSPSARHRILSQWERACALGDPARRVMEGDSVLDHALRALGFEGPLGEKLKRIGARFPNLEDVWEAHKLRNRIAHEPGVHVSERDAERAMRAFERALRSLIR